MDSVRCFAGYVNAKLIDTEKDGSNERYVVVIFANNYHCENSMINKEVEKILLSLFSKC